MSKSTQSLDSERLQGYVVAIDAFGSDAGTTIADIVNFVKQNFFRLLAAGILGGLVGIGVSFLVDKRYEATTVISYSGQGADGLDLSSFARQFGAVGALAGLQTSDSNREEEMFAALTAKQFIGDYLQQNALLPVLFEDKWDEQSQAWDSGTLDNPPTLWDGINLFKEKVLSVDRDARSGLVSVRILWRDPATAAHWANDLVAKANQIARERAIHEAQASLNFLNKELEEAALIDIRGGIFQMMQSNLQTITLASVRPDFAYRVVDPALVPDIDDFAFPNRLLFLVTGGLAAGLLAFVLLLVMQRR